MAFLNKSIVKLLIAFLFVLFLIFVSPNDSQAVHIANTRLTDDIWTSLRNQMNDNILNIYIFLRNSWNSGLLSQTDKNTLKDFANKFYLYHTYIDVNFEVYNNKTYLNYIFYCYDTTDSVFSFSDDDMLIYYDDNTTDVLKYAVGKYNCKLLYKYYIRTPYFKSQNSGVSMVVRQTINDNSRFDCWLPLYTFRGDYDYIQLLINGILSDFEFSFNNELEFLKAIAQNTKDTKDSTKELTDFVKNDSIDSSSSDFNTNSGIGDNTLDMGVGNIFNNLYNTISNWNESTLRLPFPNSNKYIEINSSTLRGDLAGAGGSVLMLIIQSFWLFIVGRFIVKDVLNYYEKLKSGDIVKSSETNIKADML